MVYDPIAATEMLKALGDPTRWDILRQIAQQEELAASTLEETLPVSKPTISYHMKILSQAGLIEVFKRGRSHYYRVRRDALSELIDEMRALMASGPRLVGEPTPHRDAPRGPKPRTEATLRRAVGNDTARGDELTGPPALLTW